MSRWLSIIGIGEDGYSALSPAARTLVENAELIIGGTRHLAMLPTGAAKHMSWPSPIHDAVKNLPSHRDKSLCILATGDPFCFGIGRRIAAIIPINEMTVIPSPSAFSLACARLGWSSQDIDTLTLHGRPGPLLEPAIQPNAKLLILAQNSNTPNEVAKKLIARGYEKSKLTVLECIGGDDERIRRSLAIDWAFNDSNPLNVVAVECIAGPNPRHLSRLSVLPDEAFQHDGQITKQEVRAATLAALAPAPGQLLWDVGAGSGSISIEWMRLDRRSRAIAVESKADRLKIIAQNAAALGTPDLEIIGGKAPEVCSGLAKQDAVFIGGGFSNKNVFETCWRALNPGGVLVANVVTVESEQVLMFLQQAHGGSLTRIAIARVSAVGTKSGWQPLMPVTQWRVVKPYADCKT